MQCVATPTNVGQACVTCPTPVHPNVCASFQVVDIISLLLHVALCTPTTPHAARHLRAAAVHLCDLVPCSCRIGVMALCFESSSWHSPPTNTQTEATHPLTPTRMTRCSSAPPSVNRCCFATPLSHPPATPPHPPSHTALPVPCHVDRRDDRGDRRCVHDRHGGLLRRWCQRRRPRDPQVHRRWQVIRADPE
jgi:hypothetical protein